MHEPPARDRKSDDVRPPESSFPRGDGRDPPQVRNWSISGPELSSWLASTGSALDPLTTKDPQVAMLLANLPKDAMIRLKYVKRKNEPGSASNEPNRAPHPPPTKPSEQGQKAHTDSTKETFFFKQKAFLSPEKVPEKYKAARKLLKFAKVAPKPLVSGASQTSDKNKIIQNLYFKNQSYFYSNRIDLRTLIKSIYYQGQQIEQLKDFLLPTFKKIQSNQCYFETIFEEAKNFSETVKTYASRKISRLLLLEDSFKFAGGIEELLHSSFFAEDLKSLMAKSKSYHFKSFSSSSQQYIKIIDLLYQHYKHLEQVNIEIEKLTHIYLNNYLSDGSSIDFDTFNFHSRMFVACVYNDRLIHEFILFIYNTFKSNTFYINKYSKICEKIFEIFENFEQNYQSSVIKPQGPIPPTGEMPPTDGNRTGQILKPISNFEPKTMNNNEGDAKRGGRDGGGEASDDENCSNEAELKEPKAKKKKKNKKKNRNKDAALTTNEVAVPKTELPTAPPLPPANENSSLVLKDMAAIEAMIERVDTQFRGLGGRSVIVGFCKEEIDFFVSLVAQ
jgi:hypothetical protein